MDRHPPVPLRPIPAVPPRRPPPPPVLPGAPGPITPAVPLTGRRPPPLGPASQLQQMAVQQYGNFLKQNTLAKDPQQTALVERSGRRIQQAVERYFALHGWSDRLEGYAWEFRLVEDEQINAFCMPGGKVAVYTGILPVTKTEDGLAVVMAHEIAHAVAQHSRERMSQALLFNLGGMALDKALDAQGDKTRSVFLGLYGVGASLKMLGYSRQQELEADRLGLIFMAMAGYNPDEAVGFWQRMVAAKEAKGGGAGPVFLSTHPTDKQRIAAIRRLIPEARRYAEELRTGAAAPRRAPSATARTAQASAGMPGEPASTEERIERLRAENAALRARLETR